ncbi:hypothetical protein WA026_001915 [Henosepilachna vigintioctopunctata]|uniref:Uncharacterized protein n=1 Tax=Henosepilachna vigintioctopunctata TaxID=420089 RepID=A0AAW1UUQ8_9CUCU
MTNLSENSNRKVHETQVTTNYNQSTEENIMPISTTSKTSPIRKTSPLNKQSKESTRNEEINTTFIEQEVINRKLSEDQIDISKRKDSKTHKYIVEDNNTTRKQSDVKYNEKTEMSPTSKSTTPKTSSSRETSPLKEYPSQVRKNADIDDVNRKFINKEIFNRQVTPEVPKVQKSFKPKTSPTDKRPNTSQNLISTENEVVTFDLSRTETPERITPDEMVITKANAVPEDIHPSTKVDHKHTINNLNQYSDIISITDSTEQIIDENKVISSRKTTKLEDNFKPGTPHNVDSKINLHHNIISRKIENHLHHSRKI